MRTAAEGSKDRLLAEAARLASEQGREGVEALLHRYYQYVAVDELRFSRPEYLLGAALSLQSLAAKRLPGSTQVRVFTPTAERDGWGNGRTVVEVVTDDLPYLVASVAGLIAREQRNVHLQTGPQLVVRRDKAGSLIEVLDVAPQDAPEEQGVGVECWIHVEINRDPNPEACEHLACGLRQVVADVRTAVGDWPAMRARAGEIASELEAAPPHGIDPELVSEATSLLRWMADGQFTFLGYREYSLTGGGDALLPHRDTGLGLLRAAGVSARVGADDAGVDLDRPAASSAGERRLLIVTKANTISTVQSPVYLDYIAVRSFDGEGRVTGERRFLGLFGGSTYHWSATRVPYVSGKVRRIIEQAGFSPDSHEARDLLDVLETYPRDELFQADVEDLVAAASSVVRHRDRRQSSLYLRRDEFGRFMSCLVYLPRDRFTTNVRLHLEELFKSVFDGQSVVYTTLVGESSLARLHFVVRGRPERPLPDVDVDELQAQVEEITANWADRLRDAGEAAFDEEDGVRLAATWADTMPESYKEDFDPKTAVADLHLLEELADDRGIRLNLYRPADAADEERRLKLYRRGDLSLTALLPIFTDMGLEVIDERPYEMRQPDGTIGRIYDFGLRAPSAGSWTSGEGDPRQRFQDAFEAVWSGKAESDRLNGLVLDAGLDWRQIVILRAVAAYLQQAGTPFSLSYVADTLFQHPHLARLLVELFDARFNPDCCNGLACEDREKAEGQVIEQITGALDDVDSLDHDRIIRSFLGVIQAVLRTNYYQQVEGDGSLGSTYKPTLAFKLEPRKVPGLPAPKPMFEIWVYSPRLEGVHLRFGKVARGGLRWSDRRQDFRTEILGLVKAQMVKNAVIVPTGSKGGFFPKQLPNPAIDREGWLAEGRECYRTFVSALLDVTDNLRTGEVIPPQRVVRHDQDDPYLVVAADKGTATFSDTANEVSEGAGFWLGDAYASGGSAGYDHKEMGITARGAWESVKRHFREMDHDVQARDFTVVGVGDMSGDVFGNGMLLSKHIRLVAAFDHRHIFVDPNPDSATSFAERKRLFELPRSSWEDYNSNLISEGGGVYPRAAKAIRLTDQVKAALGIEESVQTMTPAELMRSVLLAPVDLLWNGGIGTYIKSASEQNADIGDRANDAVRVNGCDLRCKVVGEGGNLGASQLGRVEAALAGVRLNTDAIDNSAGVASSDHEVNIKILLSDVVRDGRLSLGDRNELLASMTEDVAAHVLRDNYEQNVLLGNARSHRSRLLPVHSRYMRWLETHGGLDRALEFLPDEAEIERRYRAGEGLTSPELAVLVAYTKLMIKRDLLDSDLPDQPWFHRTLAGYFPRALRDRYWEQLGQHPLRREIIVNSVANSMVNDGGISFTYRALDETGATAAQLAAAYVVGREIFDLANLTASIEALDNKVSTDVQTRMYLAMRGLLDRAVRWFLLNRPGALDVGAEIKLNSEPVGRLMALVPCLVQGGEADRLAARVAEFHQAGVARDLAVRVATMPLLPSCLDIVQVRTESGEDLEAVGQTYFSVSDHFGFDQMLAKVVRLSRDDRWSALARGAMRDDLYAVMESLTRTVLRGSDPAQHGVQRLAQWAEANETSLERSRAALEGMAAMDNPGLAPLSVTLRTLRGIARAGVSG